MVTALLDLGVPAGALPLAECLAPGGDGHAVLTIEMEGMTLVSDVRQTGVPEWDSALFESYLRLYRQVPAQKDWQRLGNAPTLADLLGNHGAGTSSCVGRSRIQFGNTRTSGFRCLTLTSALG